MQGPQAPSTELVEPEGRCASSDVVVTPLVEEAVGGQDVTIGLQLQTREAAACTWKVSRNSVAVKILDGSTEVWTSRQCPGALPEESVVVRWAVATVVEMTWADARESDRECSGQAGWAMPGDYTVIAAALGGEPSETTFDLIAPAEATADATGDASGGASEPAAPGTKRTRESGPEPTDDSSDDSSGSADPAPDRSPRTRSTQQRPGDDGETEPRR
ncbi:hypothetical protein [Nocardioides sambongensis]|uniref:hypothetical protein n=1 Tax=Nocardioides sambongensis TaxID=2589074 RepID=UPI001128D167|nr:hypothetical protein [Nocardioides sambongensis]